MKSADVSTPTYSERAEAYARKVVDGEIIACRYVKLACQRHLDDIEKSRDEGYPYVYSAKVADHVCDFIEGLPHIKGNWALREESIVLEDWQCFLICVPFGWLRRKGGKRRFRRVYDEVPRKNAKSTLAAALGLYMLVADDEYGAEVYSGAGSEKQAHEVFRPARLMALRTPAMCAELGVRVNAKNLHVVPTESRFEPIIGKPGDGASPSFSITDEYHEHDTPEQYDTMVTGMGAREQPMAFVITTAGSDTEGPCYAACAELLDVLEGKSENEEFFGIVYTIDDDVDWTSEEALRMANPNMGISVFEDYLRSQQRDAVNDPRKAASCKTKHLNVWVTASSPFFNYERFRHGTDETLKVEDFVGEPCWVGLDLAAKLDLTVDLRLFRRMLEQGTPPHYYAFLRAYCPEERVHDPRRRHYAAWAEQGWLTVTKGNIVDLDFLEANVKADAECFRILQLGFDPFNATQVAVHLQTYGIECVEVPQTVKHLSDPMKWTDALIVDGRLHHDGNPILAWAIGNVTAQVDRNDNVFPRKEKAEKKIDPAIALIIAVGRALAHRVQPAVHLLENPPLEDDFAYAEEGEAWL